MRETAQNSWGAADSVSAERGGRVSAVRTLMGGELLLRRGMIFLPLYVLGPLPYLVMRQPAGVATLSTP